MMWLLAAKNLWAWVIGPIGRYVVLALVVVAVWAWERDNHADNRVAKVEAKHAAQMAEAAAEVRRIAGVRDVLARSIVDEARKEAAKEQTQTQTATNTAVQRVTVYRDRPIPANCPTHLPSEVEDEGRKAVERANR